MHKRTLLRSLAAAAAALPLGALAADKSVTIGVTMGPHAQIAEVAKRVAEKSGLKVRLVEFGDFIQPNAALAQGEIDANIYSMCRSSKPRTRTVATSSWPWRRQCASRWASTPRRSPNGPT